MNGFKLLLGLLMTATFTNALEQRSKHVSRIKRFLFNKYQPNTNNGNKSVCCICDDLGNGTSCYERCRNGIQRNNSSLCTNETCATTATLLNGKFYLSSRCEAKAMCLNKATNRSDAKVNGCDTLTKGDMVEGTVCRYCCESYDTVSSTKCLEQFEKMINHTNNQNETEAWKSTVKPSMSPSSTQISVQNAYPICETCTNSTNCVNETCKSSDTYCENVISFENGKQKIIKKGCSTFYECKYDHSMRNSECDPTRGIINNSYLTCLYCCLATKNFPPCNSNNIPKQLAWFDDKPLAGSTLKSSSSSSVTLSSRTSSSKPEAVSSESPFKYSTKPSLSTVISSLSSRTLSGNTVKESMSTILSSISPKSLNASVTPGATPDNKNTSTTTPFPSTSNSTRSKSSLTFNATKPYSNSYNTSLKTSTAVSYLISKSEFLKTTTQTNVTSTTQKSPFTLSPSQSVLCKVCSGPEYLCEKIYADKICVYPNNYCLNTVTNKLDGTRLVNRRCDSFQNCYRSWFLGSSDVDKCRRYDERQIVTLEFDCTFCCIKDGCNKPLRPKDETLYKDD